MATASSDVAVANFKDSKVSVLFGNGDGTLQSAVHYPVGAGPSHWWLGREEWARSDLVSANGNGGLRPQGTDVTVLRNLSIDGSTPSTTTVTSSQNPSDFGQPVTFTATVTGSSGTPTGTVTFTSDGNPISECPLPVNLLNGVATCVTSSLPTGSHPILGSYSGDSTYAPSTGTLIQTVKLPSTTALTSSKNPSNVNDSVTFTATVTGSNGTPTGTVTFTVDGNPIPECPNPVTLNGSGVATCTSQSLPAGSDLITASYSGDSTYDPSSKTLTQTVSKIDSDTVLTSSVNPSYVNQFVTFTATVTASSPGGLSPTGTVTFTDNGNPIPECPNPVNLNGSGVATCTSHSLPAGSDTIEAAYNGDSNFNPSSKTLTQTVNKIDSDTALTSSKNSSNVNDSVTFTATVTASSPGGLSPTGTVTFTYNSGTPIPECPLAKNLVNGVATCTTQSLPAPSDVVNASYNGDNNFNPSSKTLTQIVNKIDSDTALTSSKNPSNVNDSVTFTATVTASSPGGRSPTGTVTFTYNSGTPIPECPLAKNLVNGVATCTTQSLPAPSDVVKASYNGDSNFNTSSKTLTQTVSKIDSDTALTSSKNPSNVNDSVTFTATVTASSPGGLSPTGTVTFTYNSGTPIPECPLAKNLVNGVATLYHPVAAGTFRRCQSELQRRQQLQPQQQNPDANRQQD